MQIKHQYLVTILPIVLVSLFATAADSQVKQNRIQNTLTGADKCLDIINDGENNQLTMSRCGNLSGQRWSLTANQPNRKNYRLKTPFTGTDKCLDASNDDNTTQPMMAQCNNVAGQRWRLIPSKANPGYSGYYLLRNVSTSGDRCLEIINDGENNKFTMAQCGNVAGQSWKVTQAP